MKNPFFLHYNWEFNGPQINPNHSSLFLGSCFAQEVGKLVVNDNLFARVNPHGIVYNPHSLAQQLLRAKNKVLYAENDLVFYDGLWYSWHHHHAISNQNPTELLAFINNLQADLNAYLQNVNYIFITPGTTQVFTHKNQIVANCHKLPSQNFEKSNLSVTEIVNIWGEFIQAFPQIHFVFSISPVRYLREGLVESNLSKSTLRIAFNELEVRFNNVHYFPAFEWIIDVLRDYRFFKEDMVHPTPQAVAFVYDKFKESFLTTNSMEFLKEWQSCKLLLEHRIISTDKSKIEDFENLKQQKINAFNKKWKSI